MCVQTQDTDNTNNRAQTVLIGKFVVLVSLKDFLMPKQQSQLKRKYSILSLYRWNLNRRFYKS